MNEDLSLRFFHDARTPLAVLFEDASIWSLNEAFAALAAGSDHKDGAPFSTLFDANDRARVARAIAELGRGKETSLDARVLGSQGPRAVHLSASRSDDGSICVAAMPVTTTALSAPAPIVQDVDRQSATLDLLGRVLESAPLILWSVDKDGNGTGAQGKGLDLLGIPAEAIANSNVFEMYKDQPHILDNIVRALAGEESRSVTSPGGDLHFETWYVPLRHKDGEIYGMMGFSIDASERIKNEIEIREKLKLIERQSATIRALATPIIRVWDEVLCLPVIGTVDSARTADMMQSLLDAIVREQARFAIVDLTGVEVVDTSTADHLIQLFRAAKVLGVDGILCGIRPAVAQTVVALGLELASVRTMRSLQEALKWCIRARSIETGQNARLMAPVPGQNGSIQQ